MVIHFFSLFFLWVVIRTYKWPLDYRPFLRPTGHFYYKAVASRLNFFFSPLDKPQLWCPVLIVDTWSIAVD